MSELAGAITVRLPNALAECANGVRELSINGAGDTTLADVLDQLAAIAPAVDRRVRDERGEIRRYVNVYVGDAECRSLDGLGTGVVAGSTIWIIPSVAGGSARTRRAAGATARTLTSR